MAGINFISCWVVIFPLVGFLRAYLVWFGCMIPGLSEVIQNTLSLSSRRVSESAWNSPFLPARAGAEAGAPSQVPSYGIYFVCYAYLMAQPAVQEPCPPGIRACKWETRAGQQAHTHFCETLTFLKHYRFAFLRPRAQPRRSGGSLFCRRGPAPGGLTAPRA